MTASSSSPRALPRALSLGVKLLVSGLLVAIIAWKVGPAALVAALRRLDPGVLALALVLTVGFVLGRAAKWLLLARTAVPSLSYRDSVLSLLGGMGLGMITPGRAGEFTRVAFMPEGDRLTLVGICRPSCCSAPWRCRCSAIPAIS